jgi:hypothetical protein
MKKLLAASALASILLLAQNADDSVNARLRREEADHPQILHTLHMLTDR